MMRNGQNRFEHNERPSQEYQDVETLERKPAQISNVPPRASAHPSALASVRPKYPYSVSDQQRITPLDRVSDQQRITPFDGITNSVELTRPGQQRDDILTEPIFHNMGDRVSIDEIDTIPPDTQAQLRSRSKRAAYESVSQMDTSPAYFVQGKQGEVCPPVENRSWRPPPNDVRQMAQLQRFSLEHWVDNVRWWLLFPGRLEFLLWLIGAIALVLLTSFFLLVITTVWTR